jgi:regulator of sigma E protease
MVWMRGDERMSAEVHSEKVAMEDQRMLGLEFRVALTDVRESVPGAVVRGVRSTFSTLGEIFVTISRIISADVGPKNMGGIITISRVSYRAAEQGFGKLLYMTAIISASLAFLNILPIPVLDGGHLVFLAIEKIRGRRLSERTMTILQSIGFAALILLVVFVTWNDIARLVN